MAKPTILIIDDELNLLKSLSLILTDDYDILTASNGREAIQLFKSNPSVSLILLDLTMPVMNGAEALAIIRETSREVKVIIMTGNSSHDYAKKCAALNVQGYVEKPFDIPQLLMQIRKELGMDEFKALKALWPDDYEERFDSMGELNKKTVRYVEKHYNAKIELQDLAEHFRVSREHLSRKFLDGCGINLKAYIKSVKIEKGKEALLKDRDLSIREIAASVGMNDDKHFCRLFKEETGLTPGEYRKSA